MPLAALAWFCSYLLTGAKLFECTSILRLGFLARGGTAIKQSLREACEHFEPTYDAAKQLMIDAESCSAGSAVRGT